MTRELEGDGFRIENLVYESRPGLVVTANLYPPAQAGAIDAGHPHISQPSNAKDAGRIAGHGHDLGAAGLRGAGARPPRPRRTAAASLRAEQDYREPFRVGRQDYYFRYNVGLQLHLVGESLMGWMVWDLMRGVDVLLAAAGHRQGPDHPAGRGGRRRRPGGA